jgi:hypothetical protein
MAGRDGRGWWMAGWSCGSAAVVLPEPWVDGERWVRLNRRGWTRRGDREAERRRKGKKRSTTGRRKTLQQKRSTGPR